LAERTYAYTDAVRLILALVALALVAAGCDDPPVVRLEPAGVYVSIGDSIAAGNGASDPDETAFVPRLARTAGDVRVENLAVAGATTTDVIDSQLGRAVEMVAEGEVTFVTVSAGGNDLAALIPNQACVEDPLPPACPLDETLELVERNLVEIVTALRDAHAGTPIVLLAYPNFFSGTRHEFEEPAGRVLPRFAETLERIAAQFPRVYVADPSREFEGRAGQLTNLLADPPDPHPNDGGHLLIADEIWHTLREGVE
jgi:lysophospholipase L1-like esterase